MKFCSIKKGFPNETVPEPMDTMMKHCNDVEYKELANKPIIYITHYSNQNIKLCQQYTSTVYMVDNELALHWSANSINCLFMDKLLSCM